MLIKLMAGAGLQLLFSACTLRAEVSNPILFADFSDPDVIRVENTYYLVASSFNHMPGVPVLSSSDLVNWNRIGYVVNNHPQAEHFSQPRHGDGLWAPCIRYHDGKFWVFIPDPDFGIYVSTAEEPAGPWSEPHLLLAGQGIIDPTPLWDADGQAYLLHGWAKSRAGFNNILTLHKMSADGRQILDEGQAIIDGDQIAGFRTLEGPKLYQRDGYYYVFAPAGGVSEGWQTVFRARNILGPYEYRVTLEQGMTAINGPHQGAWVVDSEGADWFFHFQDLGAFGRIVHLETMSWQDDWPIMGADRDGNGVGEPVAELPLGLDQSELGGLTLSDEFDLSEPGLQWQWNANWQSAWYSLEANSGQLRLYAQPVQTNLWDQPALLTQMLVGPEMTVSVKLALNADTEGTESGLLVYGYDYAWLGLRREGERVAVIFETCQDAMESCIPESHKLALLDQTQIELKVQVDADAKAVFSWRRPQDDTWQDPGLPAFTVKQGRWVGARVGLFSQGAAKDYADIDYFRVETN